MSAMSIEIQPAIFSEEESREIYERLLETLPASMHQVIKLQPVETLEITPAEKRAHPGSAWIRAVERLAESGRRVNGWELQRVAA